MILQLCNTNDDHIMYGSWDMKHHRQNFLLFWPFLPFHPTNNPKNQNVEKKKKILGDIILHNCTKNHDHMLYCSWDMARDGCNLCFYFLPICAIFCLFTPQQPKKEKKNVWTYQYFTHVYQQLWSHDDGRTNGRKKWHIEVRAPPKKYFCFILLADKISLPGWFYFVRYWAICVLQLFVNQVVASWILKLTLSYQLAVFSTWTKSQKKIKYLENEKSFKDKIKSVFRHF